jgi:carbonic anhydrase
MSPIDELLKANEDYAGAYDKGSLSSRPGRGLAVVTCMDARILPAGMLGLREGDAHVIRNAGGRASAALPSLIASQRLGETRSIMLIHHADCAMRKVAAADAELGELALGDVDGGVREDLAALRDAPGLAGDTEIRGFVYEEATGRLREVA